MPTRAEVHRQRREDKAMTATLNPGKYGLNRRLRRTLARELARTTEINGAGIRTKRRGTNRTAPKPRRARVQAR